MKRVIKYVRCFAVYAIGLVLCAAVLVPAVPAAADPLYTISGTVYDGANTPVPYPPVYAASAMGPDIQATSDASGHYTVEVPADHYTLQLYSFSNVSSVAPQQANMVNYTYPLDVTNGDVTQNLHFDTVSVTVTAYDANNNPLPNTQVVGRTASGGTTTLLDGYSGDTYTAQGSGVSDTNKTNNSGQATLTLLKGLTYMICADTNASYEKCNASTITPTTNMATSVTMPQLHTFSGTLYDGNHQPMAHMPVYLSDSLYTGTYGDLGFTTDASGHYSANVPAAQFSPNLLGLSSYGYAAPQSVNIRNDDEIVDLRTNDVQQDLQLDTALLNITVQDASNNPVAGAETYIRSTGNGSTTLLPANSAAYAAREGDVNSDANTNGSGQVSLYALKGLEFEVCAINPSDYSPVCTTPITPTGTASVVVALP